MLDRCIASRKRGSGLDRTCRLKSILGKSASSHVTHLGPKYRMGALLNPVLSTVFPCGSQAPFRGEKGCQAPPLSAPVHRFRGALQNQPLRQPHPITSRILGGIERLVGGLVKIVFGLHGRVHLRASE
jgi:hypothetical protein